MSNFPDYEAAADKYFKRFGASTDERTDLGADIKAIVDAALGDEPLYRLDDSEPDKTYSEETIGAFIHTTLGYVRTGVLAQVWPKDSD